MPSIPKEYQTRHGHLWALLPGAYDGHLDSPERIPEATLTLAVP
jgi:hypothetical protein